MQASTTMMVPDRHLTRVGGLNQTLYGVAAVLCPPLGALLLEVLPMHGVLAIDVVTAILAIAPLVFVAIPLPPRRAAARTSVLADLREGLRFVARWKPLLAIILIATTINLFANPAGSLTPLLVTQHFGGGAIQLATLQSVFGIGMVAGGLLLGVWGGFRRRIVTVVVSLSLMGVAFCTIGLLPATAFAAAVAAFGLRGMASPVCDGALFAMLQSTVPHEMQGRVLSLLLSGAKAASPLGLAMAGPVADRFGIPVWYAIAGLVMVICSLLVFVLPGVLHLEDAPPAAKADAQ